MPKTSIYMEKDGLGDKERGGPQLGGGYGLCQPLCGLGNLLF